MDRLKSLEIFVRAVECGSFAAVAEEKNISAQMVGKHIRALEASLKAKLLNKSTRYQSLTPAGEQYYRRCKTVLAELTLGEEDVLRTLNEPCGRLNIAAGVNFGICRLAAIVAKFQNEHPKMNVNVNISNHNVDLLKEGYDIIFHTNTIGMESLIAKKIRSYKIIVCASPYYLENFGTPTHPNELVDHQCLQHSTTKSLWQFIDDEEKIFAPAISSRLTINSGQALLNAAIEGAGITIQPSFQVTEELKNGLLVQVLDEYPLKDIDLYMIYPPYLRNTTRLNAFIKYIEE